MSTSVLAEDDYIIGANDVEIQRLGQQHAIWRETALAGWKRAGLKPGMTVLDMGSGPGHASFDLAQLVGPEGRVIAVDQSALFLEAVEAGAKMRGLSNITTLKSELGQLVLDPQSVDFIWSRWVMSFLSGPEQVLQRLSSIIRPGGILIAQEYAHYETFSLQPSHPVMDRFIEAVKASWRAFGGEPNIGRQVPGMLANLGWSIQATTPHVFATRPGEIMWEWPIGWLTTDGIDRMVELNFLSDEDAKTFREFLAQRANDPRSLLTTPMVLETIARKT